MEPGKMKERTQFLPTLETISSCLLLRPVQIHRNYQEASSRISQNKYPTKSRLLFEKTYMNVYPKFQAVTSRFQGSLAKITLQLLAA